MAFKENASTDGSTPVKAEKIRLASTDLCTDHTTFSCDVASRNYITSYLKHGKENALAMVKLTTLAGLSDQRTVRKLIESARRDGEVILVSNEGYFLPSEDPLIAEKEIKAFLRRWAKTLETNRAVVRSAAVALSKIQHKDQISLSEENDNG